MLTLRRFFTSSETFSLLLSVSAIRRLSTFLLSTLIHFIGATSPLQTHLTLPSPLHRSQFMYGSRVATWRVMNLFKKHDSSSFSSLLPSSFFTSFFPFFFLSPRLR
jgi:hypothetical protein